MAVPESIQFKIFRAKQHLDEFHVELAGYYDTNPSKIIRQPDCDPNVFVGRFEGSPVPGCLPVIIGDCLQNLRSALDYLVTELVLAAKNTPGKHNGFPICGAEKTFDNQVTKQRKLDGIAVEAFAEIQALQPYREGQFFDRTLLWILDDLCNVNKHRRILLTTLVVGTATQIEIIPIGNQALIRTDLSAIDRDAKVGPFPIVTGPRGRGVQVDVNPNIVEFVAFDEGFAKGKPIDLVVGQTMEYVANTIALKFSRFFE